MNSSAEPLAVATTPLQSGSIYYGGTIDKVADQWQPIGNVAIVHLNGISSHRCPSGQESVEQRVGQNGAKVTRGNLSGTIPRMNTPLAVLCLLLNIIIPGLGTMVSGLSVLCCAESHTMRGNQYNVLPLACVNILVGVSQLFTVTFLCIGWVWSITWGIMMVTSAYAKPNVQKK
ncbi:protein stum homolog [Ascaphus truei]|uniref:protein stum homolog n=1 Tax=Ascaphus truei TaxID=8439 RepID=UPI003F5A8126